MRVPRLWRLRWLARGAARRLRHPLASPALVLMYHRVVALPTDPQLLGVAPRHFSEHLEVLRTRAHPVSLEMLATGVQQRQIPARAVAVTLDDGYADNLLEAKPRLEEHEVPATVFVTAGRLGSADEFWWDELDRLLLQPGSLPRHLELTVAGRTRAWDLGAAATYGQEAFTQHRGWHIERLCDPTPRQSVYRALYDTLHDLPVAERQGLLDELRHWAGASASGRASHRLLTIDEVAELRAGRLVEVGAHSMTHPSLADLPAAAQQREIQGSKARLEEVLGQPISSFAYPHGSATDETVAIVRDSGFRHACSSRADTLWDNADP
jgi:peptidoglycan/xylan/chitin deacetylase (PgdA/CDA1 family)